MEDEIIQGFIEECKAMQSFLEEDCSDEPHELSERLSKICVFMARSGDMLAKAKYLQDQKRRDVFDAKLDVIERLSATVANKLIESDTAQYNYIVNWLDRINRACVHQADSLRTIFSYVKENLKMTRNGY